MGHHCVSLISWLLSLSIDACKACSSRTNTIIAVGVLVEVGEVVLARGSAAGCSRAGGAWAAPGRSRRRRRAQTELAQVVRVSSEPGRSSSSAAERVGAHARRSRGERGCGRSCGEQSDAVDRHLPASSAANVRRPPGRARRARTHRWHHARDGRAVEVVERAADRSEVAAAPDVDRERCSPIPAAPNLEAQLRSAPGASRPRADRRPRRPGRRRRASSTVSSLLLPADSWPASFLMDQGRGQGRGRPPRPSL